MKPLDLAIVGGGIVGLATAWQILQRHPGRRVVVLEKEAGVGQHQSGHNSGVLHSGIYYAPGSRKAANCRAGKQAMEEFCRRENIPHEICGKVIVAVDEAERPRLEAILARGQANGVRCELIDAARLAELEPHAVGVAAIHVPEAGIVDYRQVCRRLAELIAAGGGRIVLDARVTAIRESSDGVALESTAGPFSACFLVACGGLHSDRLARLAGVDPAAQIVPFRGEYYQLRPQAHRLCRNLIYPVPDPAFPFLGVHFTRLIGGGVECGPNAVLALAREGYRARSLSLRDLAGTLSYGGFWRLARRHWRMGLGEMWRSASKRAFVKALARLVPAIAADDLVPGGAGVRAQAVASDGRMVDDFLLVETARAVHVCNAPSPAATASLEIGRTIVERLAACWS